MSIGSRLQTLGEPVNLGERGEMQSSEELAEARPIFFNELSLGLDTALDILLALDSLIIPLV